MNAGFDKYLLAVIVTFVFSGSVAIAQNVQQESPLQAATSVQADLKVPYDLHMKAIGQLRRDEWWLSDGSVMRDFVIDVSVAIPSKFKGFQSYDAAMDADVWVTLSSRGEAYAECQLVLQPLTWRGPVNYTVKLMSQNDAVKPFVGICDVDLTAKGIQVGIPVLGFKDAVSVYVKNEGPATDRNFLKGYCE